MKFRDLNYHNVNHAEADRRFTGGLTYVGTFNVKHEYSPSAVYSVAKPDQSKGHKSFLLLTVVYDPFEQRSKMYVRGMEKDEIHPFAKRAGIYCFKCDDVIFSCMRHHSTRCKCGNVGTDGGDDEVHTWKPGEPGTYECGILDIVERTFNGRPESSNTKGIKPLRPRKRAKKASALQPVQAKPKRKRKAPTKARRKKTA